MYCVYVIQNDKGKIYIGQTENLGKRLQRHNQELPTKSRSYTKINKGIWKIIYKEEYNTRIEAIHREKELKTYRGRMFIKNQITGR